jgi:hypothetical protein
MSIEQFPSSAEQEQNRRITCFLEGVCPHCGDTVDDTHANDHYGFCSEVHKYHYETEHSLDVALDYKQTHGQRLHLQYLEDMAAELNIPTELFRKLHDEEHKTPAEIRAEIEEYNKRQAA